MFIHLHCTYAISHVVHIQATTVNSFLAVQYYVYSLACIFKLITYLSSKYQLFGHRLNTTKWVINNNIFVHISFIITALHSCIFVYINLWHNKFIAHNKYKHHIRRCFFVPTYYQLGTVLIYS